MIHETAQSFIRSPKAFIDCKVFDLRLTLLSSRENSVHLCSNTSILSTLLCILSFINDVNIAVSVNHSKKF